MSDESAMALRSFSALNPGSAHASRITFSRRSTRSMALGISVATDLGMTPTAMAVGVNKVVIGDLHAKYIDSVTEIDQMAVGMAWADLAS